MITETLFNDSVVFARALIALSVLLVVAIFVERSLAVLFDMKWFKMLDDWGPFLYLDLDKIVSFSLCLMITLHIDRLMFFSFVFEIDQVYAMDRFLTALALMGGSGFIVGIINTLQKRSSEITAAKIKAIENGNGQ